MNIIKKFYAGALFRCKFVLAFRQKARQDCLSCRSAASACHTLDTTARVSCAKHTHTAVGILNLNIDHGNTKTFKVSATPPF